MPIYKGSTKLGTIYHGRTKNGKVYKGSTLVYSGKEKNLIVKYTVINDGFVKGAAWYGFIDGLKYNAGEQNILPIYMSVYTEPYGIITSYSGNSISIKAENSTITYTKHGSRTVCGLPFVGFYDNAQLYPEVDYFLVSPNAQVGDMAIRGGADFQGAGGIIISDDGSTISSKLYAWNGVSNFSTSFSRSQSTNSFNYLYRG